MSHTKNYINPEEVNFHKVVGVMVKDGKILGEGLDNPTFTKTLVIFHIDYENGKDVLKKSEIILFGHNAMESGTLKMKRGGYLKAMRKKFELEGYLRAIGLIDEPTD